MPIFVTTGDISAHHLAAERSFLLPHIASAAERPNNREVARAKKVSFATSHEVT
jgi:hypothetical protein